MLTYFRSMGGTFVPGKDRIMTSVTTDIRTQAASAPAMDRLAQALERLACLSPTYRRLQDLDRMPDAALAERGLSRPEALQRIFGARFYT